MKHNAGKALYKSDMMGKLRSLSLYHPLQKKQQEAISILSELFSCSDSPYPRAETSSPKATSRGAEAIWVRSSVLFGLLVAGHACWRGGKNPRIFIGLIRQKC